MLFFFCGVCCFFYIGYWQGFFFCHFQSGLLLLLSFLLLLFFEGKVAGVGSIKILGIFGVKIGVRTFF